MIKNEDVDLIVKIKAPINKLKNINQKPRKTRATKFPCDKHCNINREAIFVHIVTTGFIGNVMLHPNKNIQDYQMSQMMPPFNVGSVL